VEANGITWLFHGSSQMWKFQYFFYFSELKVIGALGVKVEAFESWKRPLNMVSWAIQSIWCLLLWPKTFFLSAFGEWLSPPNTHMYLHFRCLKLKSSHLAVCLPIDIYNTLSYWNYFGIQESIPLSMLIN